MLTPTRVYVSVPNDGRLSTEHLEIKRGIFDRIRQAGFQPQELKVSGDLAEIPWSFENVQHKLGRCQGAVVLGLVRWDVGDAQSQYKFVTAYNHFEGALALAAEIPTFILMHEHVHKAGIVLKGRSPYYVKLPDGVDSSWLQSADFSSTFESWVKAVNGRSQVFLAYADGAKAVAEDIRSLLTAKGVSVMQREVNDGTAMQDIERASKSCMGAIVLFMKEDANAASIRENLILTTGYFLRAKGSDKLLIIAESGTPLPASLQGQACLRLQGREDLSPIEKGLQEFVIRNL